MADLHSRNDVAGPAWPERPALSRRLRMLSGCGLGLMLLLLPVRLYCQSPAAEILAEADSDALLSFSALSFSPVVNDSRTNWHPHVSAALFLPGILQAPGLDNTNWAQNQQNAPAGEKQEQQNPTQGQKRRQQHSPSATTGSPGHIFWVVPAFKVDYEHGFKPLTTKEKFEEWAQGAYDPVGLSLGAVEAGTLEYSSTDGFCGYGSSLGGYGECYGSLELDANVSSFIGDFALTSLLHQDPRYFRRGEGSFGKRLWYAVSRVFVTYNDSGRTVFYSSALSGTVIAAGLSNLYYPSQDVGVGHTMSRIGLDLGNTALYNAAAEFWPDIDHELHQVF